jgi:hypothetical protein
VICFIVVCIATESATVSSSIPLANARRQVVDVDVVDVFVVVVNVVVVRRRAVAVVAIVVIVVIVVRRAIAVAVCLRTGKLSKSALEETGAKSYMCLEIKRVH